MLLIAKSLRELDFRQLMDVYEEGNRENARQQYPQLPESQGVSEAEQDFYAFLKEGFFAVSGAFYAAWTVDGRYVSALRMEPYRDGWLVEAVETKPDCRRNGYAYSLMKAVFSALQAGKVYSHIHKKNLPSQKLHEGLGFRRCADRAVYIDGSVNDRCATYLLELGEKVCPKN